MNVTGALGRVLRYGAPAAAFLVAGGWSRAHPIHTTMTEVTHDEARATVRISMRGFVDDFSAAVARSAQRLPPADSSVADSAAFRYLGTAIALHDAGGRRIVLRWCGARRQGESILTCLETPPLRRARGLSLRNAALFDLHADQVNVVRVHGRGGARTLLFMRGDGAKRID